MLGLDAQTRSEAEESYPQQLPQMAPALSPDALRRIERQLRTQRKELLAGIARIEAEATFVAARDPGKSAGTTPDILRGELEQTEQALERLAHGTYGTCQLCGAPIPLLRLQVIPSASRCGACVGASLSGGPVAH